MSVENEFRSTLWLSTSDREWDSGAM